MKSSTLILLCSSSLLVKLASSVCPFNLEGTPVEVPDPEIPSEEDYDEALLSLDIVSVFDDLYDLMLDSQDCWPADIFNDDEQSYAGLFIRLAWHCSGTFRSIDGKGGCAGGRQRYEPESAWPDNVNLDKARALLYPIKEKYGDALSWGDLFVFAGTAAMLQGGGPVTSVCAGRIDNDDGTLSEDLVDMEACINDGNCDEPSGTSTMGLIYVNPEGVFGNPDPSQSAIQIRDIFGRMGMNDYETVALIGGGHAFGKCHGACPLGAGPGPDEQPYDPWPGLCGDNFPEDAWTSGIEGAWTNYPFRWDNDYFQLLAFYGDRYELTKGSGDKYQWDNKDIDLIMLTTDLAFLYDDTYKSIVNEYATDIDLLNDYFSNAWEKLVTSGGTWADNKFCVDSSSVQPRRGDDCPSQESIGFTNPSQVLSKCDSSPCDCDENNYCESCDSDGCGSCKDGYFQFGLDYACANCQDIFGDQCLKCVDFVGCDKCEQGWTRSQDSCGVWYCRQDVVAVPRHGDDDDDNNDSSSSSSSSNGNNNRGGSSHSDSDDHN